MQNNQKLVVYIDRDDAEGLMPILRKIMVEDEARVVKADKADEIHWPADGYHAGMMLLAIQQAIANADEAKSMKA